MTHRLLCQVGTAVLFILAAGAFQSAAGMEPATEERVGRSESGRVVLPVPQTLTPHGRQIELPGMRPQAIALSPDGRLLVTSGKTNQLIVLEPATGETRQRVALPAGKLAAAVAAVSPQLLDAAAKAQLSYTGLVFSPDGRRIYLSNVEGDVKVFGVDDKQQISGLGTIALPPADAPKRKAEIPAGLAVSADGKRLYVVANLSNGLLEMDAESGRLLRRFEVGVAPYDVVLAAGNAFVSNWGGRRPTAGDLIAPAGRGMVVRVDPVRHIASEGSVTVIDLGTGSQTEIVTQLHASALALSPDGKFVVCANSGSDNLSVISTEQLRIIETIWAKPSPNELLGATPNALAFAPDGRTLYVANGTQNAVAVIDFLPGQRKSKLRGLIPVGWFPGALAMDAQRRQLCVANIKGMQPEPMPATRGPVTGLPAYNSRNFHGSLSLVPLPSNDLPALSQTVWNNLRRDRIEASLQSPRPNQPARAVPERIGEPSLIRHVVYIIKENRTYDQVLGDMGQGRGDPKLCIFGQSITPNQHKLASEFVLLDNTYCAGILSADGHNWSTSAFANEYLERSFANFPRSYPDGMGDKETDALAWSSAGFLWDRAFSQRVTVRNYGEFTGPAVRWKTDKPGKPEFLDCFAAWQGKRNDVVFESVPSIPSLNPVTPTSYVGWSMEVPDQYRADFVLRELRQYEARGEYPQLVFICLPNDHTSGTKPRCPTPAAMVADNDLAVGRLVEGYSRSRFWKDMAIFIIEDDPQDGWDHISGYRTTAYLASPYVRRGAVVSTHYSTVSLLRTMEQILGLRPMNQFDAAARPMFECFTDQPDTTPFAAVAANIALDSMNPEAHSLTNPQLRADALASSAMDFTQVDRAPEDALNRILWRAMRGPRDPYPAWAVRDDDDD